MKQAVLARARSWNVLGHSGGMLYMRWMMDIPLASCSRTFVYTNMLESCVGMQSFVQ